MFSEQPDATGPDAAFLLIVDADDEPGHAIRLDAHAGQHAIRLQVTRDGSRWPTPAAC